MTPWASPATDEMGETWPVIRRGSSSARSPQNGRARTLRALRRNEVLELVHRDLRVDRSADRLQSRGKDILVKALRVPA